MGVITRSVTRRALTANDAIRAAWGSIRTASGTTVSEQGSLQVMAVITAVRILAEGFAQVPLKTYRRVGGGRAEAREHRLYRVLHERPNPEMTSFTLREVLMGHLGTWGNAYCEISYNFFDEVLHLWPLRPDRTRKRRVDGRIVYEVRIPKNQDAGNARAEETVTLPARNVLHIPGFGFDGFVGYSLIAMIREGVGLAKAYEEFSARFFGQGTSLGTVFVTDKVIPKERRLELEQTLRENHEGLTNAQRFAIMDGGLKPEHIGIPPQDAQFIESRKFQKGEIMGFYRIPPHLSGDTEKQSSWGTGIAEMSAGFIKFTMDPWFVRAEQAMNVALFGANAQGPLFCEFDREGFLRGDFSKRLEGYTKMFDRGVVSNKHIARLENWPEPPTEIWVVNGTMVPIQKLEAIADARTKPPEPPPQGEKQPDEPAADEPQDDEAKAAARAFLARAFRPALADATDRILRRERADVSRGVEKLLKAGRAAELEPWLESFYREHREYARKQIEPVLASLYEAVHADVARELGRAAAAPPPAFVRKYAEGYAERLGTESLEELRRAIRGEPLLERVFAAWERRELAIAVRESARAANAFALVAYRALEVARVRWVARDAADGCLALAGRAVATGDEFAERVSHPPREDGCECVLLAVSENVSEGTPV